MAIPAAQYVRMSTEDQQFSIANQRDRIAEYAARHDFSIIRTYDDAGRSGVVIKRRGGLMQLLKDVVSGDASYKAILVYDVSRWGRFQNPDEAAHYEFICQDAGIPIHYCAEQFANDGTMPSSIMKALKRTMAAEYSRELSTKVYDGQKRIAGMGYRIGGTGLYGLKRMAISRTGKRRYFLSLGERKIINTDRIILVPGRKNEVECVRYIFHAAANEEKSTNEIARVLNRKRIKYIHGREWSGDSVWRVLKNPQYAGYSVWNRTTCKMHSKRRCNAPSEWVLKEKAFTPLVDESIYKRVQKLLAKRNTRPGKPDKEVIGKLKRLLRQKGELSHKIIKKARGLFEPRTYYTRYGSYLKVYEMVGYKIPPERLKAHRRKANGRLIRVQLLEDLSRIFPEHIRVVRPGRNMRKLLQIDSEFYVSIVISHEFKTPGGLRRWFFRVPHHERGFPVLLCRVNLDSMQICKYFIVPAIGNTFRRQRQFGDSDEWLTHGKELDSLDDFYDAAKSILFARKSGLNRTLGT